jgi:hypothetical protein
MCNAYCLSTATTVTRTRLWSYVYRYKVVYIWPVLIVCKLVTVCPGHIWTTLYIACLVCTASSLSSVDGSEQSQDSDMPFLRWLVSDQLLSDEARFRCLLSTRELSAVNNDTCTASSSSTSECPHHYLSSNAPCSSIRLSPTLYSLSSSQRR